MRAAQWAFLNWTTPSLRDTPSYMKEGIFFAMFPEWLFSPHTRGGMAREARRVCRRTLSVCPFQSTVDP
jgi:hypothetical protein